MITSLWVPRRGRSAQVQWQWLEDTAIECHGPISLFLKHDDTIGSVGSSVESGMNMVLNGSNASIIVPRMSHR